MSAAAMVVVCALDLLGRSADRLPPIRVLETRPPDLSAHADAFLDRGAGVIYLIASAPAFRTAQAGQMSLGHCREREALQIIASIIVHEEWHLNHGPDERGAYLAQLTALQGLGVGPGRPAYGSVTRSMHAVLAAQARSAAAGAPPAVAAAR